MVIKGRDGQRLVAETPFTLLALTRHPVEAHEEQWFARCCADNLRSFPLTLLEVFRLVALLGVVGPLTQANFTACAVIGWLLVIGTQYSVRRYEVLPEFDQRRALRFRQGTIRIRAVWWCIMLGWGTAIMPQENYTGIIALGIVTMVIDGISVLALPHLALGSSISGGVAMVVGSIVRGETHDAAMVAVAVLAMASFMHWSIYNLYYLFATRRIRTRRLSQSNETIQLMLNQYDEDGSDWLYEIDSIGCIRNASVRFAQAAGCTVAELEGTTMLSLVEPGHHGETLAEALKQNRPFRNLTIAVTINGEQRWWSISGRPAEADGNGWRGFIADVSSAKQAEAKVAFMAHYDLLTQLPNRTLFNATLARAFARLDKDDLLGLLYIDLDHFKAINDGYGHAAGDRVLAEVAKRIEAVIRPRDMVARLGGDEFVILLPDLATVDGGLVVAERVLEAIGGSIDIDGQVLPLGASIGLAFAPHNAKSGEELLLAADLAMYNAKSRGRRGISIFDPEMQIQMKDRRALELDLRAAIARGEMALHYQPLIDIQTGATSGYEALLRWTHPQRGMVSPADFIPIAEETGLIVEIGEWVVRTALGEAANWPEHLTLAVNLSPAQMRADHLMPMLVSALAHSGVSAHRLELEITENLLMQESDEVLSLLHKLRALGIRIALDDFGTGYSSLNYLRSFPFDKIKIDRCFVNELADRDDCKAIVRSVIALANDLNMTTTAEGVEDIDQLEALRNDGCDQVQGFYFSRALPASELHYGAVGSDGPQPADYSQKALDLPPRRLASVAEAAPARRRARG